MFFLNFAYAKNSILNISSNSKLSRNVFYKMAVQTQKNQPNDPRKVLIFNVKVSDIGVRVTILLSTDIKAIVIERSSQHFVH